MECCQLVTLYLHYSCWGLLWHIVSILSIGTVIGKRTTATVKPEPFHDSSLPPMLTRSYKKSLKHFFLFCKGIKRYRKQEFNSFFHYFHTKILLMIKPMRTQLKFTSHVDLHTEVSFAHRKKIHACKVGLSIIIFARYYL